MKLFNHYPKLAHFKLATPAKPKIVLKENEVDGEQDTAIEPTSTAPTLPAPPSKQVNRAAFSIGSNNRARVGQGTSYSAMARAMGGNVTARQLQDYAKAHLGGSFKANKEYDFNDIRKNLNMPAASKPAYRPSNSQAITALQPSIAKATRANEIRNNFSFQGDYNDGTYGGR